MPSTPLDQDCAHEDLSALIARAAPFADLPSPVLKFLSDISERHSYAAGETVFSFGQNDGAEFFLVASGRLKAAVPDSAGGAMVVEDILEGQFFGLAEAAAGGENARAEKATLTAETDAEVVAVDVQGFRGIVAQRPSLTRNLMQHFARALVAGAGAAVPAESSPEQRIFAALMRHVERDPVHGDWRIGKMPKHREIAEASGVEEAAAAAAIALLIQEGVARREYPGLVIEDMARFGRLAA